MINSVVLMGRLVATPELRQTQNGTDVTSFTLAVDRNSKDKQVDFIDCVAWKNTAEFITKYFQKGSMIAVVGSLQARFFEDNGGNKRKVFEILVNNASFCGGKNDTVGQPPMIPNINHDNDIEEIGADDDLPF